jgi:quercetin dioxygenase-like cupin family protein
MDVGHEAPRSVASGTRPHGSSVLHDRAMFVRSAEDFRSSPAAVLFEGRDAGVELSLFVTTFAPGRGPDLHVHPYPELFLVEEGTARFTVDGEHGLVESGHLVVAPAAAPHRFENAGPGTLRVVSVHPSGKVVQDPA